MPHNRCFIQGYDGETGDTSKHFLRILDLASRQIATLPGDGRNPHWSPDGRFIAGTSGDRTSLKVCDLQMQRWSALKKVEAGWPTWSRDGKFIYFLVSASDPRVFRIRLSGGEAERVVDLKGFYLTALWGEWMDLDPEDNPLMLRDTGSQNIYTLTLDEE
jgi:Tol biopolymer transport system component